MRGSRRLLRVCYRVKSLPSCRWAASSTISKMSAFADLRLCVRRALKIGVGDGPLGGHQDPEASRVDGV